MKGIRFCIKTTTGSMRGSINILFVTCFQLFIIWTQCFMTTNGIPFTINQFEEKSGTPSIIIKTDKAEIWNRKTEYSNKYDDSFPVDHTLAIVIPITVGIFLMVIVFFLYIFSKPNVTSEAFDYESLSSPLDEPREHHVPSTSHAAFHNEIQDQHIIILPA